MKQFAIAAFLLAVSGLQITFPEPGATTRRPEISFAAAQAQALTDEMLQTVVNALLADAAGRSERDIKPTTPVNGSSADCVINNCIQLGGDQLKLFRAGIESTNMFNAFTDDEIYDAKTVADIYALMKSKLKSP